MEIESIDNAEQTSQGVDSSDALVKTRPSSDGSQKHIPSGKSDTSELKIYSRAILYCIVYGNNSADESRLLRELYWNIVETLAHLNGSSPAEDSRYRS